ncbi:MAG: sodium:melibiose symporter, partial [Verrucomicrobia bacterium]
MTNKQTRTCSTSNMIGYATGDIANSLTMNSFAAFIMLFYTKALGISPVWAGIIMASSTFWDAISDPIMGYISDNTRSKYGRRHPYMLFGGVLMVVAFFCFWAVPGPFMANKALMIGYLMVVNLLFRTAYTVFIVPYGALGFEICQDYTGRTKLQSIKTIVIMLANLLGPAMAWVLFFPEVDDTSRAASVPSNYFWMGTVFSIVSLVSILFMLFYTRKEMRDSRTMELGDVSVKDFFVDMKEIVTDRYFIWVFLYGFAVLIGIILVASFQMYVYEDFMKLEPVQKTFTHGGTMVGMMLGAFFAAGFAKRYDKKGAVYIGGFVSIAGGVLLATLFLSGVLKPGHALSVIIFALLNSL